MSSSFHSRHAAPKLRPGRVNSAPTTPSPDWRCTRCGKLLGLVYGDRVHLRFTRGHEYIVGLPVVATCRDCGTLNQTRDPGAR